MLCVILHVIVRDRDTMTTQPEIEQHYANYRLEREQARYCTKLLARYPIAADDMSNQSTTITCKLDVDGKLLLRKEDLFIFAYDDSRRPLLPLLGYLSLLDAMAFVKNTPGKTGNWYKNNTDHDLFIQDLYKQNEKIRLEPKYLHAITLRRSNQKVVRQREPKENAASAESWKRTDWGDFVVEQWQRNSAGLSEVDSTKDIEEVQKKRKKAGLPEGHWRHTPDHMLSCAFVLEQWQRRSLLWKPLKKDRPWYTKSKASWLHFWLPDATNDHVA